MATTFHNSSGQSHDRIEGEDIIGLAAGRMAISGTSGDGSADDGLDITATQKMMSAFTGSLLTSLLVTPLDVVRVRLQSQNTPKSTIDFSRLAMTARSLTPAQTTGLGVTACCREVFFVGDNIESCLAVPKPGTVHATAGMATPAGHDCAVEEVQKKTYRSTMDGIRKIARNEGFTALWRGLSPTLVMMVPANLIYFTGYEWLRYNPKSPFSKLSDHYAPLTGGSVARVLAVTAVSPLELVRTRMQAASGTTTTNHLTETFKGIKEMVGSQGYTSLWRGLTLTLWRDVPFSGLYWWGYETIRGRLTDMRDESRGRTLTRGRRTESRRRSRSCEKHTETFLDSFAAGALSGAFASIVTMPFDVGKTRTQVYRAATAGSVQTAENRNMAQLLLHIFNTEGLAGLWKGWIPRTLKVAPSCAIMISSYEVGKKVFRGVNERAAARKDADL